MGGRARCGLLPALAVAIVAAGGCASTAEETDGRPAFQSAVVTVENNKWLDVNVFAVRSGRKVRLGTVTSMTSQDFRLPTSVMSGSGDLRLHIDPIGSSSTYTTGPITVMGGERVSLRVENALQLSAYMIRHQ